MSLTIVKTVCILLSCIGSLIVIVNAAPQARLSDLLILGEFTPNSTLVYAQHTEIPSDGLGFAFGTTSFNFTRIEVFDRTTNRTGGTIDTYAGGINESNFSVHFSRSNNASLINVQVRLFGERLTATDGSYLPKTFTVEKEIF